MGRRDDPQVRSPMRPSFVRSWLGAGLDTVRRLQADARVSFAEPNYVVHVLGSRASSGGGLSLRDPLDLGGCVPIPGFFSCGSPTPNPTPPPSNGCVPIAGFFACS